MTSSLDFSKNLKNWYRKNARDLPWRKTSDPYKIWISEVMLQQTTVNTVINFYLNWIKKFPTINSVNKAPLEKVLNQWQGLGYYQRVKNIKKSAKIIVEKHKGKIPREREILKKLPGFGPYTQGSVLSIAFDKRIAIVDANIRRVIMRFLAIEGYANTNQDEKIIKFLEKVMPQKGNDIFNQALMEIGALVCKSKNPQCLKCPLKIECRAFKKGTQEIIPKTRKKILKDLEVVIGVMRKNRSYYIQKRSSKGLLADLWEFPGGKVNRGEPYREALKREIKEELGVEIKSSKHIMNVRHFYTNYRVNLHVSECQPKTAPKLDKTHKWVKLNDLREYPMPSGSAKIVERLKNSDL